MPSTIPSSHPAPAIPSSHPAVPSSSSSPTTHAGTPFVLKEALSGITDLELTYAVLTKMIKEEALDELKSSSLEPRTKDAIYKALKNIHGYLLNRPYKENESDFFIHTAADVLFEAITNTVIQGKSHAIKAAEHYKSVKNTILMIDKDLNREVFKPSHDDKLSVLSKFKSVLIVHEHALFFVLKKCDDAIKLKLKERKIINLDKAVPPTITEKDRKSVKSTLPKSPTKRPFATKTTPKKLSLSDQRSVEALRKGPGIVKIPAFPSMPPSSSPSSSALTPMFSQLSLSTSPSSQSRIPPPARAAFPSTSRSSPLPSSPKKHP